VGARDHDGQRTCAQAHQAISAKGITHEHGFEVLPIYAIQAFLEFAAHRPAAQVVQPLGKELDIYLVG
jgi:hypothetical protein